MDNQPHDVDFRDQPSKQNKARKYDILRTPKGGIGNLVLLGEKFQWQQLHYWRGKSMPHNKHWCEPCEYACEIRERGYIFCTPNGKVDIQILEVTDQCFVPIKQAMEIFTSLRGCIIGTERKEKKANGKLRIVFSGKKINSDLLPIGPDLAAVMRRIWGLGHSGPMVPLDRTLDLDALRCGVKKPQSNGSPK